MAEGTTIALLVMGVILTMAIYWLYRYALRDTAPLEKINLASRTVVQDAEPASVCYFACWLYVNSWTPQTKTILIKGTGDTPSCHLYLNANTPELICETNTAVGADSKQTTILQRSFPLQAWTHVVLAFDSNVMDYYMNGKLVTSAPLQTVIAMDRTDIQLGGSGADIYMSKFIKRNKRATASIIKADYESSKSILQKDLPDYNLDVTLMKNGEVSKKLNVF